MNKATIKVLTGLGVLGGSIGSAQAAVPANVSTALTDALADAGTVAAASLIIVIAIAAFKYMRRGA